MKRLSQVLLDSKDVTNIPARTNYQREQERLAARTRKQVYLGIGMCIFWTGVIALAMHLTWIESGRPK
jgi:hypothetical protein